MNEDTALQIISRAMGAVVDVVEIRDPADGSSQLAIRYACGTTRWISTCRFHDSAQAHIAGTAISDFSGARFSA